MEKEYEFHCEDCDTSFKILTESDEKPTYCPFCGFELEDNIEEDEDDDTFVDYSDDEDDDEEDE